MTTYRSCISWTEGFLRICGFSIGFTGGFLGAGFRARAIGYGVTIIIDSVMPLR